MAHPQQPVTKTSKVFILYCRDFRLESCPDLSLYHRRTSDKFLEEIYHFVFTLNLFSTINTGGVVTRAFSITYDASEQDHVTNFIAWSEQQLSQCDTILLVCSPTICSALRGEESSAHVIDMEKGQVGVNSIINALPQRKVLPIFLNMPKISSWLPFSLQSTPSYEVNFKALQEGMGVVSEDEFSTRAYMLFEHDHRLRGFLELIRTLRGEKSIIDERPSVTLAVPGKSMYIASQPLPIPSSGRDQITISLIKRHSQ